MSPTRRYYTNTAPTLTTSGSITSGATSVTVSTNFTGYPVQFPYFACLDRGTASAEVVSVTNVVGSVATIARAQDGTLAASHPAGATIDFVVVAKDYDEANAHTSASTAVHGITGAVVGTTDAQTLTNKTLTSPAINGGTATLSTLDVTTYPTSGGVQLVPAASVVMWASGSAPPAGWLLCDSTAVSRTTYAALFAAIGTTFGAGNGSTTFNLPDFRARFPVGIKGGDANFDNPVGHTGGGATHSHPLSGTNGQADITLGGNNVVGRLVSSSWTATSTSTATGPSANSSAQITGAALSGNTDTVTALPPYMALNFIIKT